MVSTGLYILLATISAPSETVLLDFTASWCGPCKTMEPTIARLQQDGYPVRKIDVDRNQKLADQFNVTSVPCFVLVSGGREVDRVLGATSYDQLKRMFARVQPAAAPEPTMQVRAQSPEPKRDRFAMLSDFGGLKGASNSSLNSGSRSAEQAALNATVKLKVSDPQGNSYGTGTIIDTHGNEALVITCGHIFRDSGGRGEIMVELFAPAANGPVRGTLIAWDAKDRDIALVSIQPGIAVTPVRVASANHRSARGNRVFSVGCDQGRPPTVRASRVTAIDKYAGSPNIEVAGQPIDGRSGGGLFTDDGMLIGICNAADPADDEGIYAALATIHWQLDQIGQRRIYEQSREQLANNQPPVKSARSEIVAVVPPRHSNDNPRFAAETDHSANIQADEVICIIRSPNHPNGRRMIVLDKPSRELLSRLVAEAERGRSSNPMELTQARQDLVPVGQQTAFPTHAQRDTNIIRGQR